MVSADLQDLPKQSPFVIERCEAGDFDGVLALLRQLWPGKDLARETLRQIFEQAVLAKSRVLLQATVAGEIVGFGSMSLKMHLWHGGLIGWIDELVIDERHRGQGVGKLLLEYLIGLARERGCRGMELDSAFHRLGAHAFYEELGFEKRAYLFSKRLVPE